MIAALALATVAPTSTDAPPASAVEIEVQALGARLEDPDAAVQIEAVRRLGALGTPSAVTALRPLLRNKNDDVRTAAAEALGNTGVAGLDAIPDLLALASEDGVMEYRWSAEAASQALTHLGAPAIPALVQAMDSGETVGAASGALASMGAIAVPALTAALERGGLAAENAALAAGALQGDRAPMVPPLIDALQRERISAWSFRSAMVLIGPAAVAAAPTLVEQLRTSQTTQDQQESMQALLAIGPAAIPVIENAVEREVDAGTRARLQQTLIRLRDLGARR
jgi:HEAT repeat protein